MVLDFLGMFRSRSLLSQEISFQNKKRMNNTVSFWVELGHGSGSVKVQSIHYTAATTHAFEMTNLGAWRYFQENKRILAWKLVR